MRKHYILAISILLGINTAAQQNLSTSYHLFFEQAYAANPEIPKGLLEGVAFAQTRITHLTNEQPSCAGLPAVYGVMGLTENGQGYFDHNLQLVSDLSGYSADAIKNDPAVSIMAYAAAFSFHLSLVSGDHNPHTYEAILHLLAEIPKDDNVVNHYALDCFTYEVFRFMADEDRQAQFNFPAYEFDYAELYGEENFEILSSSMVTVDSETVTDVEGNTYTAVNKSLEYGPALWVATPTCNYSSRSGTAIAAVTIHTIQGTYSGAISWAQNCSASVSYHYVARSSDGQITQMVYEADKAWHVGSENPYTIGIEHEGYVSNPAWYTEAMYTGSSGVVKDICNSGYGINPLRTFQGPATSGSNVLGGCTKIKGHQHFPNQTHTDPGIYWNWEHYYQLINNNPTVTAYTASSGVLYDTGGAGANYQNDERKLYLIEPANVVNITVNFQSFNLEANWDYMYIYDGSSTTDPVLGVFTGTTLPSTVSSTGETMLIEFRSDCSTTASGWQLSWTSVPGPVPGDVIPPATSVSFAANWKTTDFPADFSDADNSGGSGISRHFYQVIDYDGTEWRANANNGFFSDNFDLAIHPDWTSATGSWTIASGYLNQSDEVSTNTNLYASLNQDVHDMYLYHWAGKISGTGTNKRAGFHFMCDDATLPNRGNSYFVWFREDNNKVQIYKVVNDVFTLEADLPLNLNPDQWYDFKTVYDKTSGLIQVWVNDVFVASWTDPAPYTSGNAVSFRSGECVYDVNDLKIYHNRDAQELITVGPANDVRFENPNSVTPSAKIKSIVIDSSANVSSVGSQLANVDWTPPAIPLMISDGTGADIALTTSNTELSANWSTSTDPNSDIARYWYAIGTTAGATDVVGWTDNWFDTTVTHSGLSLAFGTTYYFSVKAENGAGLLSAPVNSDGQLLQLPVNPPSAGFDVMNSYLCVTDSIQFLNSSNDATDYYWSIPGAIPASSVDANPWFQFPASGTYEVTLTANGPGGTDDEVQFILVETHPLPVAAFSQSATVVNINSPFVTFTNNSTGANGYVWDFGDGEGSTDFEPWHSYTSTGIYTVMLVAINGNCPNDTTWSTVEVTEDAGFEDHAGLEFHLHPNPAHGLIHIHVDHNSSNGQVEIVIVDSRGRVVLTHIPADPEKIQLDLTAEGINAGVYFVRVTAGEAVAIRKLFVE
jgi:PKD repeat protein/N-acetyl-anhydromuramyl-L-alanine amidase AmpD